MALNIQTNVSIPQDQMAFRAKGKDLKKTLEVLDEAAFTIPNKIVSMSENEKLTADFIKKTTPTKKSINKFLVRCEEAEIPKNCNNQKFLTLKYAFLASLDCLVEPFRMFYKDAVELFKLIRNKK